MNTHVHEHLRYTEPRHTAIVHAHVRCCNGYSRRGRASDWQGASATPRLSEVPCSNKLFLFHFGNPGSVLAMRIPAPFFQTTYF